MADGSQSNFIRKRDGRIVPFNPEKITDAIYKAAQAVGGSDRATAQAISDSIIGILTIIYKDGRIPTVENVQDLVEKMLIERGHAKVAKAYILYREQHRKIREGKSLLTEGLELIESYLDRSDWRVNENSNMSYSLQGLNNHIATAVTAKYWLERIYPPEIRNAHVNCDFHIHDLGLLSAYCVGWDLRDLLIRGFGGVAGKVESRPAKHFRSALGHVVNFFYTLQGESAGAQAFANFDTYLAPFIWYDKLSYEEVKQSLQEFIFNMNIPTRVGFQTPFTNVTLDLTVPSNIAGEHVIIGGEAQEKTYGQFQDEMDMFNIAFAEAMSEGDAKNRIFTFPIPTYNISRDFDWDNAKLDPMWEMTAKYGIPYFANFINSDMDPEDARSMCCRLRLDNRELRKRGGGLFGANPLTGSIGVVTINLPRIAYASKNEGDFFETLERLMALAKSSLEIKRKALENFTENNLYPYTKHYLSAIYERNKKYWINHFSTIGLIGMNETCLNMLNADIATIEGKEFALKVLDFMRNRIMQFQEETGNFYNLEATPAEGVSYRFAMHDRKLFKDIRTSGTQEPYYTNSVHLPVGHTDDLFDVLDHQDELQTKFTGGTVVHLFLGEKINDVSSVKMLVKKIAENYSLPYFTITPTFSVCPVHGYIPGAHKYCPYDHSQDELIEHGIEVDGA
ncbi:MAG TPA: ribonucleoside triphosphate reductase [Spirochaetota bacterium]|nr:ribonucleoside triphosphate reductase [Spirochaetota bacterium]HPC39921.1 ribonucleoside triphosphate reductase [Spirochaetota bacterium]HPL18030.1 ribonucleoside triphosphate reductase [Spirochaetota bacterium]HQF08903.1 ribonucleoside triphosphate reductase [Spirochaetota bacterium]HQH97829.1 ribonucleoside triphosphate reductase [Spirochaetota bacterium]